MFTAAKRLYHTADRQRLVEEGDPAAAFLVCSPGDELSDEQAEALGLKAYHGAIEDKALDLEPEAEEPPEDPTPRRGRR